MSNAASGDLTYGLFSSCPYGLPLTREGYRQWILRLHTPLVAVLATEQAQQDLERACGYGRNFLTSQNCINNTEIQTRFSFPSLFQPFGCLPSTYSVYSADGSRSSNRSYGCPQNVPINMFDKSRILDMFPVRFADISECVAMPLSIADTKLLKSVEDNLPSIEALGLVHRLHPFSSRRSNDLVTNQPITQLLERKGASLFSLPADPPSDQASGISPPPSSQRNCSKVSLTYPHGELRITDTYSKTIPNHLSEEIANSCSTFNSPSVKVPLEVEADVYDQLYLTVPTDSTAISSASRIPCIWFDAWFEVLCRTLDFSEFESLTLPFGFVFIASTRDRDPAAAFEELGHIKNLPFFCRQQLLDSNAVRAYVLVHTTDESSLDKPEEDDLHVSNAFGNVCSAFPPSSCHILMFRPRLPLFFPTNPLASLIHYHFDSIQAVVHTIITRSLIPFMERLVKRLSNNLTLQRKGIRSHLRHFWGRRSRTGNSISSGESTLDATTDLLWVAVGGSEESATTKKEKTGKLSETPSQVSKFSKWSIFNVIYGEYKIF